MKPLFCFHKTVADEWRSLCTIIYHQNGKLIKKKPGNFAIYLCYYSFTEFRMPLYCIRRTPARYWMFYATGERVILNRIQLTKLQNTIGRLTNMNKKISPFFSLSAYKVGFTGNEKSNSECVRIRNKHYKSGDHSSPTRHGNMSFKLSLYAMRRIQKLPSNYANKNSVVSAH